MNVVQVTAPLFAPVTLAEVWEQLRMTPTGSPASTDLDSMLERNIESATRTVELMTLTSMIRRTLRVSYAAFVEGSGLQLPRGPVYAGGVDHVKYYDASNVLQTLGSSEWYLAEDGIAEVRLVADFTLSVYDRPDAVRIQYQAGYAPAVASPATQEDYAYNVPKDLKEAVLITVELLVGNLSPQERTSLMEARKHIVATYNNHALA